MTWGNGWSGGRRFRYVTLSSLPTAAAVTASSAPMAPATMSTVLPVAEAAACSSLKNARSARALTLVIRRSLFDRRIVGPWAFSAACPATSAMTSGPRSRSSFTEWKIGTSRNLLRTSGRRTKAPTIRTPAPSWRCWTTDCPMKPKPSRPTVTHFERPSEFNSSPIPSGACAT